MSLLFDQIADVFRKRQVQTAEDFDSLARQVAHGQAPAAAKIAALLDQFQKSPDELQQLATYHATRLNLASQMAMAPGLQAEADEASDKLQVERARWEKLTQEHNAIEGPLVSRLMQLSQQIARARGCEEKLRAGYQGTLRNELAAIQTQRQDVNQRKQSIEASREHHASWARPAADFLAARKKHNPTDSEIDGHRKIVAECDAGLTELRAQSAALDAREQAIQAEMAKP